MFCQLLEVIKISTLGIWGEKMKRLQDDTEEEKNCSPCWDGEMDLMSVDGSFLEEFAVKPMPFFKVLYPMWKTSSFVCAPSDPAHMMHAPITQG